MANKSKKSEIDAFKLCVTVSSEKDSKIPISDYPTEGRVVKSSHGDICLEKEIGAGGEAFVYKTNTPYVAKIYKKDKITTRKREKINLMLSKKISCKGICYPMDVLKNSWNGFVGYLMPAADGIELQRSVFAPKPVFMKKFPCWNKKDTVQLCITILKKIQFLHERNIIMGNINPANILIKSPTEVYFVDVDSYQVENYPCPVGTINYTAPEIQRKKYSEFLRTIDNENFAIATLLFMIMLPGKPPYSQQGGEDPISNIIKMDFSYPFGDNSNKKTPEGPWRFIWSHLTYKIKEAFYNTFRYDGKYAKVGHRLSCDAWLGLFKEYLYLIESGKIQQQDSMSLDLFPTRLKMNPKATHIVCRLCKNTVDEQNCKEGICQQCLNSGQNVRCPRCGKNFIFTNFQKYIKHHTPGICPSCIEISNQIYSRITCQDCSKIFEITRGEKEFYDKKGFDIPQRCPECRKKKKAQKQNSSSRKTSCSSFSSSGGFSSEYSSSSSSSSSPCFITTAVCECFGKPDDCMELTTLRTYRDFWLAKQDGGMCLIQEYYNRAPALVDKIKQSQSYMEICTVLMKEYIQPCVRMIQEGLFAECRDLYKKMVDYAEKI